MLLASFFLRIDIELSADAYIMNKNIRWRRTSHQSWM